MLILLELSKLGSCFSYARARNEFHQFVLFDCFSTSIFIDARPNVASEYLLPFSYSIVIDGLGQM